MTEWRISEEGIRQAVEAIYEQTHQADIGNRRSMLTKDTEQIIKLYATRVETGLACTLHGDNCSGYGCDGLMDETKLHEEAARKIRDTFDLKPTSQDIAEFLAEFYGPRLRRIETGHGGEKIEVLRCKNCGRLVISVDDTRVPTYSWAGDGHGDGKCSGAWTILVSTGTPERHEKGCTGKPCVCVSIRRSRAVANCGYSGPCRRLAERRNLKMSYTHPFIYEERRVRERRDYSPFTPMGVTEGTPETGETRKETKLD